MPAPPPSSASPVHLAQVEAAAGLVIDGFADYDGRFGDLTRRAARRFARRDWQGARRDAVERIELYDVLVRETLARLDRRLDDRLRARGLWRAVRGLVARRSAGMADRALLHTFHNSLLRRSLGSRGIDASLAFLAGADAAGPAPRPDLVHLDGGLEAAGLFDRLLDALAPALPWQDRGRCLRAAADLLPARLAGWGGDAPVGAQFLATPLYRDRRAYLVGRMWGTRHAGPVVLALANEPAGLRLDALLTALPDIATLFGATRSYFQADLAPVAGAVRFLAELMPGKPVDELYTVLGRARQGKTERWRALDAWLQRCPQARFRHAEGERGMVMAVFVAGDYPLVVKVIRDRFAPPKDSTPEQVRARYRMVLHHERAGRLLDAQVFRDLRLPLARFEPVLRDELLRQCAAAARVDDEDLVLSHCYLQRRLRPLDRLLRDAPPAQARAALLDWGQAVADLARAGLFPGDLLTKNFGVTAGGRVVFYDYDELCPLAQCRFRAIPAARHDDEELHDGPWFHVGPDDVFPEQFPTFLGVPAPLRDVLAARHGHLFDPAWWRAQQAAQAAGDGDGVAPYPETCRLPVPVPPSTAG